LFGTVSGETLPPPPPPPADVIVEKIEGDPDVPNLDGDVPPAPPPPTVIGYAVNGEIESVLQR
jgi:hypothetical protein